MKLFCLQNNIMIPMCTLCAFCKTLIRITRDIKFRKRTSMTKISFSVLKLQDTNKTTIENNQNPLRLILGQYLKFINWKLTTKRLIYFLI